MDYRRKADLLFRTSCFSQDYSREKQNSLSAMCFKHSWTPSPYLLDAMKKFFWIPLEVNTLGHLSSNWLPNDQAAGSFGAQRKSVLHSILLCLFITLH
jgi:hypothetical protein